MSKYLKIIIAILVLSVSLYYGSTYLLGLKDKSALNENQSSIIPPLTEAQKLEAAKAPAGMVYVPEGEYLSGIPSSNKKPLTTITLKSFYIDRLEVTNEQYLTFMNNHPEWQRGSVSLELQDGHYLAAFEGKTFPAGLERYPVNWVSWYTAQAFCEADRKRLPTATEWEKAARGTDGRIYPWGNDFDGTLANFCDRSCPFSDRSRTWDDGFERLAPVGSIVDGASPYGVLDMSGNVAEWVADWATGNLVKLVRGGSWQDAPNVGYKVYLTGTWLPKKTSSQIGFRCVADVVK